MDKTYKLDGRVIRELPIMPIVDTLSIASFVIWGDTEPVTASHDY